MADVKTIVETVITLSEKLVTNEKIQGMVLGKYSDGTPRSIPDALDGEIMSPKEKKKELKKIKKIKKKNKNNKFRL